MLQEGDVVRERHGLLNFHDVRLARIFRNQPQHAFRDRLKGFVLPVRAQHDGNRAVPGLGQGDAPHFLRQHVEPADDQVGVLHFVRQREAADQFFQSVLAVHEAAGKAFFIGRVQKGKVAQLVLLRPVGQGGSVFPEPLRRNPCPFQLRNHLPHAVAQALAADRRGVIDQIVLFPVQGPGHGHGLAQAVDPHPVRPAGAGKDPLAEPGGRKHVQVKKALRPEMADEHPLGGQGVLLGHQEEDRFPLPTRPLRQLGRAGPGLAGAAEIKVNHG